MPRLSQVKREDVRSKRVLETYAKHFGDRDPVTEPGTSSGTPGNWWTVFALDEELTGLMLDRHEWQFSESRRLDPLLRELALARTGWLAESSFVYSQHCRLLREMGASHDKVSDLTSWATSEAYTAIERAVLSLTDAIVLQYGRVSDSQFARLAEHLDDVTILELAFIVTTYVQSATLCRLLRLELDDRPDPIVDLGVC